MKLIGLCIASILLLSGCDDGKKAGDNIARDLTGANLIESGKAMQEKARALGEAQKKRFDNIDLE